MDQRGDLGGNGLPRDREHGLRDEVGDVWPDHVHAQDRPPVLAGDDLDESTLRDDVGLADPLEVEPLDLDVVAALDRLRLGDADGRNLGRAIGNAWDLRVVDLGYRDAGDALRDGVALGERDVGELQRGGRDVADRPDVGRGGPQLVVDLDEPAVELDPGVLEPEIV